ncbi:glutamyl-tRNA reductase [Chloroflexota bacterium]
MDICLIGINHRTAPIAIREKAAIRLAKLDETLQALRTHISHGIILSTCNRTELYTVTNDNSNSLEATTDFFHTYLDMADDILNTCTYTLEGIAVVEHLFRTACGIDSMILGEYEVLGQVRQAFDTAERAGTVNMPLRHIFQNAVRIGRKVREKTGISKNALSVSSVAVDLATNAIGELQNCQMLVIGAGEVGRLVAKAAKERGVSRILVASRTQERARNMTDTLGGIAIGMHEVAEYLPFCNVLVTCADAPHYLLDISIIRAAMQKRGEQPMVIIDIAVPRNVEPEISQISHVHLYNIDDLFRISQQNRYQREAEVKKVEEIIAVEKAKFALWLQEYKVRPVIRAMMSKAEEIRHSHLKRTMKKLPPMSEEERYNLEMMTRAIVAKILKNPINNLKTNGHEDLDYINMVKELFQLNVESYT